MLNFSKENTKRDKGWFIQTGKDYTERKLFEKLFLLWKNMGLYFGSFVNHNEKFSNYSLEKSVAHDVQWFIFLHYDQ